MVRSTSPAQGNPFRTERTTFDLLSRWLYSTPSRGDRLRKSSRVSTYTSRPDRFSFRFLRLQPVQIQVPSRRRLNRRGTRGLYRIQGSEHFTLITVWLEVHKTRRFCPSCTSCMSRLRSKEGLGIESSNVSTLWWNLSPRSMRSRKPSFTVVGSVRSVIDSWKRPEGHMVWECGSTPIFFSSSYYGTPSEKRGSWKDTTTVQTTHLLLFVVLRR